MARTFAIGDIHGCSEALRAVLEKIDPQKDDTIVALGDYVDRGPDSADVIEQLIQLQSKCTVKPLLGNHEAMMIMALREPSEFDFWMSCGGRETLKSYGGEVEKIPPSHIAFLDSCELHFETDDCFFVHANYSAGTPLDKQQDYVLLWEHLTSHMPKKHMSGKKAIVGHTPQKDGEVLLVKDYLVCIDTYCYGGGWLTALNTGTQTIIQADEKGNLRDG